MHHARVMGLAVCRAELVQTTQIPTLSIRGVSKPFGLRPKRIRIVGGGQFFFTPRGPLCNSTNPLFCFIYKMYVKRYVFKLEDSIKYILLSILECNLLFRHGIHKIMGSLG